jgi:hypothetical protein
MASDVLEQLEELLAVESGIATALPHFRRLLVPAYVRPLIHQGLAALSTGSSDTSQKARPGDLRLHDSARLDLRARMVSKRATSSNGRIEMLTRHTLVGNAGTVPFRLRRWRQARPLPNDVFDPRKRLETAEEHLLQPGDAIALCAASDGYTLLALERPGLALIAAGPHIVPFAWHYDAATGSPIRLAPVRKEWLYLQEILRLAGVVGDASLGPALASAYAHPCHFVRWATATTATRVAPQIGRELCEALTTDPHPQLRAAARTLLAGNSRS